MKDEEFKQLLRGETLNIEYKDDNYSSFNDQKIYEGVVALSNTAGGILLIGITDNGEVKGSKRLTEGYWKSTQSIEAMIIQNTTPHLATAVSEIKYGSKKVVIIEIPKSSTVISTAKGKYLKRRLDQNGKPENYLMTSVEIAGGVATIGAMDFSTTELSKCNLNNLDLELVKETADNLKKQAQISGTRSEINFFGQKPLSLLKALGLINHENLPNIAGILLFGKEETLRNKLPNAFVQFQVFGQRGDILINERYGLPLVKLIPILLAQHHLKINSDEFLYKGTSMVIPEYSEDAIREIIANALVHRDYTYPNAIQVQVYSNELKVTNPGGFPRGVTVDKLLSVPPTPRNRRLAEALYRLKLVEASGRGVDFIFYGQARYGRPIPDYSASNNDTVSVRIKSGKANLDFCKLVLSLNKELTINEMLLLNFIFFNRNITIEEAECTTQLPISQVKEILTGMHENNLIEIQDNGKRYLLKGSMSSFATKAISPKRLSKKEKSDFKNHIINVLKKRGDQSKEALADAVGLSLSQCYRLLKELAVAKTVITTANKKWSLKVPQI